MDQINEIRELGNIHKETEGKNQKWVRQYSIRMDRDNRRIRRNRIIESSHIFGKLDTHDSEIRSPSGKNCIIDKKIKQR